MDDNVRREAERTHDRNYEFELKLSEAAVNNGNVALRTALLINGGAAIAMMSFLSNLYSSDKTSAGRDFAPLIKSVEWFAWGVACAGIAIALAYFTNTNFASAANERNKTWTHPYVTDNVKSLRHVKIGTVCQFVAVTFGILSLLMFLVGVHKVTTSAVGLL